MSRLAKFFRDRLPVDLDELARLTNEPVPGHMRRWWFALGGAPAYLFVVQIVTGILLALYYQAAPGTAYESVRHITETVPYGWYIRSMHQWSATLMIATIVLHQMRVYFTGAYRKPRELNWIVGMFLLLCTLMTGFTGYSLVYEQLSYWGTTVGANIADSVPVVGSVAKTLLLGGSEYNEHTLSRLYVLHAAVLPITLTILIAIHIAIVRIQGVTDYTFDDADPEERKPFRLFPDHVYTELIFGLIVMIVLSALATVLPAVMGPPADPHLTSPVIKPEWYFYVAFRWLKLFSGTAAVLSMGLVVFTMIAWPFIDRVLRRVTRISTISIWIGIAAVITIIGMTLWEAFAAH